MAAISCGIHGGTPVLDLDYPEDSSAGTDANFVMTGSGGIVEIQGTAEGEPFSRGDAGEASGAGQKGIGELVAKQKAPSPDARDRSETVLYARLDAMRAFYEA